MNTDKNKNNYKKKVMTRKWMAGRSALNGVLGVGYSRLGVFCKLP
jgi:hypothetical protein